MYLVISVCVRPILLKVYEDEAIQGKSTHKPQIYNMISEIDTHQNLSYPLGQPTTNLGLPK